MPQSMNKSPETLGTDYKPTAGILSIDQAAVMFGCEPLAVRRAIAFGSLPDSRDSKGSIVFLADAERFIGQGMPDIKPPAFASGWFKSSSGEVERTTFTKQIRAAGAPSKVTDEQLSAAYQANRRETDFRFEARPTEAMRAAFSKTQATGFGAPDTVLTFGESALITNLRSAAQRHVRNLKASAAEGMQSDITKLYASPQRFKQVFAQSLSTSLTELAVTFTEQRHIEGRANPVRVAQFVPFTAFGSGLELNAARLLRLAF